MGGRPRALLGWEFGAGFEHVNRLLDVARALHRDGWSPVFALRELATGHRVLAEGFRILQAPVPPSLVAGFAKFRCGSYGEIIGSYGFGSRDITGTVVAAWDELIALVEPSVIIADYSPFLSLAAYGRVPVVAIGDGFVSPPANLSEFPLIHRNGTRPFDHACVLQEINHLQALRGAPAVSTLPGLIGGAAQIVCTLPELDAYRRHRTSPATGPFAMRAPPLPRPAEERIFFYLAADFEPTWRVIQAIYASGLNAHGFIRSATKERLAAFNRKGLVFYDEPLPIKEALAGSSAIVHHSGIGTSEAAMAAGRPHLLVPRHLEQTMNARSLMNLGVALVLATPFSDDAAAAALKGLTVREKVYRSAVRLSEELAAREHGLSLKLLMAACWRARSAAQAAE
jgi:UDP:flavonoid glycosyltransferase YjiC (YdhE family)